MASPDVANSTGDAATSDDGTSAVRSDDSHRGHSHAGHSHAGHSHGGHNHGFGASMDNRRRLWAVLGLNGGFLLVEVIAGLLFGSLALLADAAHMASDVAGLVIALIAQSLVTRAPSRRLTFGFIRSEVLAAQANGILLVATGGWILYEAFKRIGDAPEIDGGWVLVVALIGLAINLGSAWILFGARNDNLNMKGAFLHMMADAAGSVAAAVAGLAALLVQAYWVDPVVSVVIAIAVLWAAWGLLKATTHVLLEGAPLDVRAEDVVEAVSELNEVDDIHHLHLWYLSSESVALSGHVVLAGEPTLHEAQEVGDRVRTLLRERFAVSHATLELECHNCETDAEHEPTPHL